MYLGFIIHRIAKSNLKLLSGNIIFTFSPSSSYHEDHKNLNSKKEAIIAYGKRGMIFINVKFQGI